MGPALGIIGMLAAIAGIVMFIIALVRKAGWGVARSLALLGAGVIMFIVGIAITPERETISPGTHEETPPASEVGKSRLNPVPAGLALTFGDQRLIVLDSQRLTQIGTGWFADTPKEGNNYLIVKLKIDFLGDPSNSQHLSESDFDVVGNSGRVYEYEWLVDTDTPLKSGDFYGGATTSGDLVYEIDENETNMVLIWHVGWTTERYLQIP
jgi:hypothetical protein